MVEVFHQLSKYSRAARSFGLTSLKFLSIIVSLSPEGYLDISEFQKGRSYVTDWNI